MRDRVRFESTTFSYTTEEVAGQLACGKRTAPGPDGLTWRVLGKLPESAIAWLTDLYNACTRKNYFPKIWKTAKIIMIRKPGKDPTKVASYRPISLLNTLGKCFEKLIKDRISEISCSLIPDTQYGFRPGRATTDAILKLHTTIAKTIRSGKCALAIFLDVERAFDSLWTAAMVVKLYQSGIPSDITRLLASYLADRSAHVCVGGVPSRRFALAAGLAQGAVLSPILYNIFCADMPCHPGAELLQYADDTAYIVTADHERSVATRMQNAVNQLQVWANTWRIKLNPAKTQLVFFRRRKFRRKRGAEERKTAITLGGRWIHPCPTATYLGVRFNRHLSWHEEKVRTVNELCRRANLLFKLRHSINGCGVRTLLLTYKTFVRPIAEYRWPAITCCREFQQQLAASERTILRRIHLVPYDYPTARTYDIDGHHVEPIIRRIAAWGQRFLDRRSQTEPLYLANLDQQIGKSGNRRSLPTGIPPYIPTEALQDLIDELGEA